MGPSIVHTNSKRTYMIRCIVTNVTKGNCEKRSVWRMKGSGYASNEKGVR